ncbi:MAG: class I SAM-dependent methyltransferase [Hyphomicrobium sp.]|nr:class I SAM-dependent methyltransferase [Hyphomicrobium sp.]
MSAYSFILNLIEPETAVLDFGCGRGQVVVSARARGLNVVGADTYDRKWGRWLDDVAPGARAHVSRIESGRLPYADASFEVVFANMVFEHIPWQHVPAALREIRRVLKPGGRFIAIFPTSEIWYEGHLGVYFAHWLSRWPRLQGGYLRACYRLGYGLHRGAARSAAQWAEQRQRVLRRSVHYHRAAVVAKQWAATFGAAPTSLAADYMRFRTGLRRRGARLDRLLELACHRRACRVLVAAKSGPSPTCSR